MNWRKELREIYKYRSYNKLEEFIENVSILEKQIQNTAMENEIQSFIDATDNKMLIKGLRESLLIVRRHNIK